MKRLEERAWAMKKGRGGRKMNSKKQIGLNEVDAIDRPKWCNAVKLPRNMR